VRSEDKRAGKIERRKTLVKRTVIADQIRKATKGRTYICASYAGKTQSANCVSGGGNHLKRVQHLQRGASIGENENKKNRSPGRH